MTRAATLCVHAGVEPDAATGALVPPLVQSTTYRWTDLATPPPISYARQGNATVEALEAKLAALEGGGSAVAFGSGLAATQAILRLVPDGGRVVAGRHLYGGTTRLLANFESPRLRVDTVDTTDREALEAALAAPADLLLVETPSNPTLRITDVRHAAKAARGAGALLVVDNTFLTPLWQKPLALGADLALHSTTKYLDGHNVTLGGAVVLPERHSATGIAPEGSLAARLRWVRLATGTTLAPFEAWLTLQGAKTLHLRTRAQWDSAARIARLAREHPAARRVHYPGLPDHPGHDVHRGQAVGGGGIVALDLGTKEAAAAFASALRVFALAENLGAAESLITHPASMTHASLPPERRLADGIPDGLVRLSVGIEDPEDLLEDVRRGLDVALGVGRKYAAAAEVGG